MSIAFRGPLGVSETAAIHSATTAVQAGHRICDFVIIRLQSAMHGRSQPRIEPDGGDPGDILIWVKAVPGGSRDAIAGVIGERLKIKVTAPAEGGKANRAICSVIAAALGCKPRDVSIHTGQTNPEKIIRIDPAAGLAVDDIRECLAL